MGEDDLLFQFVHFIVRNHQELLIGGRIEEELIAQVGEQLFQFDRHTHGMGRDVEIEIVGEQRIKLHAYQTTFCQQGTVTLDDGEETLRRIATGEDNGLTTKGANLRSTDIECVAMGSQPRQSDMYC